MENYIVINGKRAELTPEQLKALGIEAPKGNAFERQKVHDNYYYIDKTGNVFMETERKFGMDESLYNNANYCTDKDLLQQRALHETLDRLLWKFSMLHNGDKIDWDERVGKYFIYFDFHGKFFEIDWNTHLKTHNVYFYSREIAEQAIEKVIKPFMAEHPEFKW